MKLFTLPNKYMYIYFHVSAFVDYSFLHTTHHVAYTRLERLIGIESHLQWLITNEELKKQKRIYFILCTTPQKYFWKHPISSQKITKNICKNLCTQLSISTNPKRLCIICLLLNAFFLWPGLNNKFWKISIVCIAFKTGGNEVNDERVRCFVIVKVK